MRSVFTMFWVEFLACSVLLCASLGPSCAVLTWTGLGIGDAIRWLADHV
jgi:hypothetical protein